MFRREREGGRREREGGERGRERERENIGREKGRKTRVKLLPIPKSLTCIFGKKKK
jgi:hypothetical protein